MAKGFEALRGAAFGVLLLSGVFTPTFSMASLEANYAPLGLPEDSLPYFETTITDAERHSLDTLPPILLPYKDALQRALEEGFTFEVTRQNLLSLIESLKDDGLEPNAYLPYLEMEDTISLMALSLHIANHLQNGRVNMRSFSKNIDYAPKSFDADGALSLLQSLPNLSAFFEAYRPKHEGYLALRAALQTPLSEEDRAEVILALEQWRALPNDLGARYVFVNIPSFMVTIKEHGKVVYRTRAVVGKPETPTVLFSDSIEHIVVNPTWTVPYSIARQELLPEVRKNPAVLVKKGYQIVANNGTPIDPATIDWANVNPKKIPFHFRQQSGAGNALGHVKFLFPNSHAIYLHDTPQQKYFEKESRAYSHGCIRVHNPFDFADALLTTDPKLNGSAVRRLKGGKESWLNMAPMPVHLVYITASIGADGRVVRYPDIYGYKKSLKAALKVSP